MKHFDIIFLIIQMVITMLGSLLNLFCTRHSIKTITVKSMLTPPGSDNIHSHGYFAKTTHEINGDGKYLNNIPSERLKGWSFPVSSQYRTKDFRSSLDQPEYPIIGMQIYSESRRNYDGPLELLQKVKQIKITNCYPTMLTKMLAVAAVAFALYNRYSN